MTTMVSRTSNLAVKLLQAKLGRRAPGYHCQFTVPGALVALTMKRAQERKEARHV